MIDVTDEWLKNASKANENIVCIVFDIDGFKGINDNYGHLFGDEIIKQVGKICSGIVRENDIIGRFGGDEFVIVLKDISLENGHKKAEKMLDTIRKLKINKDNKHIQITISIGVADNFQGSITEFCDLFNYADLRLYEAKKNGKNQVR
jgi:diguanylate cyclase (GGDEF)-like protein